MIEQILSYYENMVSLGRRGVPIDWQRVAGAMAQDLAAYHQQARAEAPPTEESEQ